MAHNDDEFYQQIILAAAQAAGPIPDPPEIPEDADEEVPDVVAQWRTRVNAAIAELSSMVFAGSGEKQRGRSDQINLVSKMMDTEKTKIIYGTLCVVEKEDRSQRVIIGLKTKVHEENNPLGVDTMRTERLDSNQGAVDLANRAANELMDHRVKATIYNEPMSDGKGRSVRVVQHIQDLGLDTSSKFTDDDVDIVAEEVARMMNGSNNRRR